MGLRGPKKVEGLTERQDMVVECLLEGLSNKQIGQKLGLAERTIKFHCSRIFVKEGVRSRAELIVKRLKEHP